MATARMLLAAALIAAAGAPGCSLNLKPGAESIFEAFSDEIPPRELAAMAIDEYDPNNRAIGTLGLANAYFADEPVYIALFARNIKDEDPAVRAAAARGLANHGQPAHAALLIEALADKEDLVRLEAARGLQRLHSDDAIAPLMQAMREPDPRSKAAAEPNPEVRAEAAGALGQYARVEVLQGLMDGLDDSDLSVNRACLSSLKTLTGQDYGLDHQAWARWLARSPGQEFAGQQIYMYPVFQRDYTWWEHLPLVPKPPNEKPAPPAGLPRG
jgi:HEAT repeat protein